jgi:DnaK suppressor protein
MAALTDAERSGLRDQLVRERARSAHQLAELDRTFDELVDAADLEPPDDEHDPDGTTAYERAQVTSLAGAARVRLAELDRALDAIDGEGYGVCERCHRPIGLARLQALPASIRCVDCAQVPGWSAG